MNTQSQTENSVLPEGGGQTGDVFRSIDWSRNPLGPCEQWPSALKASLRIMFHSRQPMFLWWGPELIQFYNDSYLPSFGVGKHPMAMGQRGQECWPEIWPIIKPQIDMVLNEGKSKNRLIPFFRNGKIEDIFWTYGYSPIYGDAHNISGVFCVCTETTKQVVAERSLKESEELLKLSLVDGEIGFWDWNAKTGYTTLSQTLMLDWGINPDTYQNTLPECMALIHPDDRERVWAEINQSTCEKIPYNIEYRVNKPSGDMIWVNAKGQYILDEAGKPERLTGVTLNITSLKANRDELKRANNVAEEARERNATLALAVSNERDNLLRLFEDVTNPSAMWVGQDLVFDRVNLPYKLFPGRKLHGRKLKEALPDDINAPLRKIVQDVFKTGVPFTISEQLIPTESKAGEKVDRWYDSEFLQMKDQFGYAYGVYQHNSDVSEHVLARKNAEASAYQLEIQTAKLEAMFSESPIGICLLRGESLICEKVNENFQKLVSPRDYVGRTWEEIYAELKGSELPETMRIVLRTGRPHRATESKLRILFGRGQLQDRYYNFTYNRILASDGTPYGIFCQCSDVTEAVTDRINLAASEESLRLALAGGHMGAWSYDLSTNEFTFDDRARDLNGLAEGEQTNEALARLCHEKDRARVCETLKNSIGTQTPYECEYRIQQFDGHYRWVYARGEPKVGADGSVQSISGVTFDISERKSAALELIGAKEVADRANQTKSSFLANMSHEIRTPLGAILGFTDLLKEGNLDASERQQFLDTISRNGKALTRIIDDILDLAKVESGKLEIEKIEFSFLDLIDDVMDLFRERTRAKGIYLRAHVSRNTPTRIVSDPTRLRQILINIVGNAVKFTNSGGVTLEMDATVDGRSETEFRVHICDTGIGISEEEQVRLFQPFVQADNSTTRKFGGSGLGLALSRRLAGALGGDVRVRTNSPNPGSIFTVSFEAKIPKKSVVENVVSARPKLGIGSSLMLDGIRVLLADDSKDNQLLITRMLTRFGANVETADNGVQAFRAGINGKFDIVLMDIQMPEMDGYEATRSLREAGFKKPIVALTAHAMAEERARTKAAGCDGHLTKPLNIDEIIDTIQRLTAIHQPSAQPGDHYLH